MHEPLCPRCGSSLIQTFEVPAPHFAKIECIGPDQHFIRWVGQPRTLDWAREFVMPFGKHKGKQMRQIDRGYLKWASENLKEGAPKTAATMILSEEMYANESRA